MQRAFETIKQLVADFKAQESAYLSPSYQESQIRQDFIDKFFTALGWDVTHTIQKNPYEQEVKIENKVSTQGSQRRADYAFFIAPNFRDVKFYAEAKKPAKNLKDAAFYHQTIRYGWNSGTPLAILTDFEEFHILDCRYKPDVDDALNRKLEYFHYSEYADEEKFKKIFYLFGREAVANGSLEKYAATLTKPHGKAIQRGLFKGGYQPVDEAFLEELDSYRETLAKAFKKENPGLGSEELTEAVQRTIDRLVFIRFLEDKQIEDPQIINYSEAGTAWKKFSAHCRTLEPKYNGLVFKKHRILDDSGFIPPDDNTFADICNELADPSSPYDFDKIPISILGSIYERFLGKVVHATAKQVRVELKPEVRKAGGVYYTPQYIVRYIVKETVGKLLYEEGEKQSPLLIGEGQGEVSKAKLTLEPPVVPVKRGQLVRRDRNDGFRKSPEEVAMMSFADIACGSGSFLIEVYSVLLEYHERYYAAHPEAAKKGDLSTRDGKQVLSLKKRQEILINNIYGVDIDFQATEVTQLSLYLKLLEEATLNDAVQFSLLKEKLLPDLRNNIICGNSLIGTDIYDGDLFASNPSRTPPYPPLLGEVSRLKSINRDGGVDKLKPMNFEDAFPAVMKRGGFDAVVGNPPYVRSINLKESNPIAWEYYHKGYKSAQDKEWDIYLVFVEKGLSVLSKFGLLGYILPNKFFNSQVGTNLRKIIATGRHLKKIVDFTAYQIFPQVTTYTNLFFLSKMGEKIASIFKYTGSVKSSVGKCDLPEENESVWKLIKFPNDDLSEKPWLFSTGDNTLFDKLQKHAPLSQVAEVFQGTGTRADKVFVVEILGKQGNLLKIWSFETEKEMLIESDYVKSVLRGRSVKRYQLTESGLGLIVPYEKLNDKYSLISESKLRKNAPKLYRYLTDCNNQLNQRENGRFKNDGWYRYGRPQNMEKIERKGKLVFPDVANRGEFYYENDGRWLIDTAYAIVTKPNVSINLKYIQAILNSPLLTFFLKETGTSLRGGYFRIKTAYVNPFPIRTIDFTNETEKAKHDRIVSLVKQMLKAKEELAAAKLDQDVQRLEHRCATLDRQIDEAVYELYGLTGEEIKIVEGKR